MTLTESAFVQLCLAKFRFLVGEFGFRRIPWPDDLGEWGYQVAFRNETTAVRVSLEREYAYVFVTLYHIVDGEIGRNPTMIDPETELFSFDLDDLICIRAQQRSLEPKPFTAPWTEEIAGRIMDEQARNLRDYAEDVLRGDFSVLVEIDKRVKQRAREQDDELAREDAEASSSPGDCAR